MYVCMGKAQRAQHKEPLSHTHGPQQTRAAALAQRHQPLKSAVSNSSCVTILKMPPMVMSMPLPEPEPLPLDSWNNISPHCP